MQATNESDGPNKVLKFTLLRKKPVYLRWDLIPIPFTSMLIYHFFGDAVFDQEHILAVTTVLLAVSFHVVLFMLNFWFVNAYAFFCFSKLKES